MHSKILSLVMTIKQKIAKQLANLSIGPIKHNENLYHLYADFTELVVLISNDSFVTSTDVLNKFKKEEINPGRRRASDIESGRPLESKFNAKLNDDDEQWIQEIFHILEFRASLCANQDPFAKIQNKAILKKN